MKHIILPPGILLLLLLCGAPQARALEDDHRKLNRAAVTASEEAISAGRKALAAAREALQKHPDDGNAKFLYAVIAELAGERAEAIRTLREIIEKHPDAKAPGLNAPASIVATLSLARLLRESGDLKGSLAAYEGLQQSEGGETSLYGRTMAHLYAAELLANQLGDKEAAARHLRAVAELKTEGMRHDWAGVFKLYIGWAAYELAVLESRPRPAESRELIKSKLLFAYAGPQQLEFSGWIFTPAPGFAEGTGSLNEKFLRRAAQSMVGEMDATMAKLFSAMAYFQHERYEEVKRVYRPLFGSDGFFAPEAGIMLAWVLTASGRKDEAGAAREELLRRFPWYSEKLAELDFQRPPGP